MIYLLEDDDSIRKLVTYSLESQNYKAMGFARPADFWAAIEKQCPELVLLDIMLPEENGLSVLKKLRSAVSTKNVPVILLTAKDTEYDRVIGLDSGADDYVSKPFGMMELMSRVRAVLRRAKSDTTIRNYHIGSIYVSPEQHIVKVNGEDITLTYKEFKILCLLMEHAGMVLTRDVLMERVWGYDAERENRTLDVHIRSLRTKLGSAGNYIETVRGIGYKMTGSP